MWIDDAGGVHTVALPHPPDVMSDVFKRSLDALVASHREAVLLVLERAEERFFEGDLRECADPEKESVFEGLAPPVRVLHGYMGEVEALQHAIDRTDWRWRLDAVLALIDYVD